MLSYKQPSWAVHAVGMTDEGKVRDNNEDSLFCDTQRGLFIVSDGMGGHQAGEVASQAVVTVLPPMIDKLAAKIEVPTQSKEPYERVLRDAIFQLSQNLRDESKGKAGLQGMGATVVVVWILGQRAHMAYKGDSRIYLFRKGKLTPLTTDHSLVALLLQHGQITPEEAKVHPARGRLSRYVGMEDDTFSDQLTITIEQGDRLLLCSDGLTGMVDDKDIERVLTECQDPEKACKVLIGMANEAGGKDNITTLIINVNEQQRPQEGSESQRAQRSSEHGQTPQQIVAPQTSLPMREISPEKAKSPRPQGVQMRQKLPAQRQTPRKQIVPERPGKPQQPRHAEQQRVDERLHRPRQQEPGKRQEKPHHEAIYFVDKVGRGILLLRRKSDRHRQDDRHGNPDKPPRP